MSLFCPLMSVAYFVMKKAIIIFYGTVPYTYFDARGTVFDRPYYKLRVRNIMPSI